MVWVGRDRKDHPVPNPCHGQGHLPPDQIAQSPIQPGLEHLQGFGIHGFSGKKPTSWAELAEAYVIGRISLHHFSKSNKH